MNDAYTIKQVVIQAIKQTNEPEITNEWLQGVVDGAKLAIQYIADHNEQ